MLIKGSDDSVCMDNTLYIFIMIQVSLVHFPTWIPKYSMKETIHMICNKKWTLIVKLVTLKFLTKSPNDQMKTNCNWFSIDHCRPFKDQMANIYIRSGKPKKSNENQLEIK